MKFYFHVDKGRANRIKQKALIDKPADPKVLLNRIAILLGKG
jgi:hypothetical protein